MDGESGGGVKVDSRIFDFKRKTCTLNIKLSDCNS